MVCQLPFRDSLWGFRPRAGLESCFFDECVPVLFITCTHAARTRYAVLPMVSHYSSDQRVAVTRQDIQQCANKDRGEEDCQPLNMHLLLLHPSIPFPSLSPPLSIPLSLLFVVAKLNGQPVADAAERGRLHLPVVDGVSKQADAVIECPLHPKSSRAEVIHTHLVDVVGMEVHHLESTSGVVEGEQSLV